MALIIRCSLLSLQFYIPRKMFFRTPKMSSRTPGGTRIPIEGLWCIQYGSWVALEVLTAVITNSGIYKCSAVRWKSTDVSENMSPSSGSKIIQAGIWLPSVLTLVSCLIYSSVLKMEPISPSKRRLTLNGLHGLISQKTELSKVWANGLSTKSASSSEYSYP
jgi:hypothetical protein